MDTTAKMTAQQVAELQKQGWWDCADVARILADHDDNLTVTWGWYTTDDGERHQHAWAAHYDGTIVDATGDQFDGRPVELAQISRTHPLYDRYEADPGLDNTW